MKVVILANLAPDTEGLILIAKAVQEDTTKLMVKVVWETPLIPLISLQIFLRVH